jgi:hypothetical protein
VGSGVQCSENRGQAAGVRGGRGHSQGVAIVRLCYVMWLVWSGLGWARFCRSQELTLIPLLLPLLPLLLLLPLLSALWPSAFGPPSFCVSLKGARQALVRRDP